MNDISKQMFDDFDLVYNNLSSNQAPGLDIFEKCMYLTKAYYSTVVSLYKNYEKSESSRKTLAPLVKTLKLTALSSTPTRNDSKIRTDSELFKIPSDVLYIVFEAINLGNTSNCFKNKQIPVVPVTHDDVHSVIEDPFKYNNKIALRLDLDITGDGKVAEILSKNKPINNYFIRYIKKPNPIILDDFRQRTGESSNDYEARKEKYGFKGDEKIDGIFNESVCELDQIYHTDIINLAAQLAYKDYKAA